MYSSACRLELQRSRSSQVGACIFAKKEKNHFISYIIDSSRIHESVQDQLSQLNSAVTRPCPSSESGGLSRHSLHTALSACVLIVHHNRFIATQDTELPSRLCSQVPGATQLKTPNIERDPRLYVPAPAHTLQTLSMARAIRYLLAAFSNATRAKKLDIPVFVLKEILCGKYGEDSKLIYNLEGPRKRDLSALCATTSQSPFFARWLVHELPMWFKVSRYPISQVYRRLRPTGHVEKSIP